MSRRTLTLLLATVLALGLTLSASVASVPYVALGPGPTFNTLGSVDDTPVLEVDGRKTFPTDGHLDLTTVNVRAELTLSEALRGWFDRDLAVVPREVVFPPDRTKEEIDQENAASMEKSQSTAVLAAARELGLRVSDVTVAELSPDSPARGKLREGDLLTTVDGEVARDGVELRSLIGRREPGDPVRIGFERDGRPMTVVIQTAVSTDEGQQRPVIGVTTSEEPAELPFEVSINLENIGGPSAGLMFALGILDKLGPESLTGGRYIAGTGTVDADGSVGPIGGIDQKLIAAQRRGAVAFLVPADNCAEAVTDPPKGLTLVKVASLSDALTGLEALRADRQPVTCSS